MATKTMPISVRITPRDAEFIAELKMEDAITPSDKIRALLKEARDRRDTYNDLATCLGIARKAVGPILNRLKEEEINQEIHSELISSFGEWLMEMLGYMASIEGELDLVNIEKELVRRIFRLCNTVVRMGIIQKAPCYDEEIVTKSLPPLMEIFEIIQERTKMGGKI